MCGENFLATILLLVQLGSPPRVRGKLRSSRRLRALSRITPACAGKTAGTPSTMRGSWDHPRVCGENPVWEIIIGSLVGSPPRVRGKRLRLQFCILSARITPACAGKTGNAIIAVIITKDHPRVCGENRTQTIICNRYVGSPPRVRGKQAKSAIKAVRLRITPACAGKTYELFGFCAFS